MNLVSSQSNEFDFFFEHPVQWIHRFNGYITIVSLKKSLLRTRNDLRNKEDVLLRRFAHTHQLTGPCRIKGWVQRYRDIVR